MEFHLSMTDQPGVMLDGSLNPTTMLNGNQVKAVVLELDGTGTVAESRQIDETRGHQHSIFYKVTNDTTDNQTYNIKLDADVAAGTGTAEEFAQIPPRNLQWSYRTYGAGYELAAASNATC